MPWHCRNRPHSSVEDKMKDAECLQRSFGSASFLRYHWENASATRDSQYRSFLASSEADGMSDKQSLSNLCMPILKLKWVK